MLTLEFQPSRLGGWERQDFEMGNILGKGPGIGTGLDKGAMERVAVPFCEHLGPYQLQLLASASPLL